MSIEDLRREHTIINKERDSTFVHAENTIERLDNYEKLLTNTPDILDDLDLQFCKKTGLKGKDVAFLFLAIGLQIARQYLLTKFPERKDDKTSANNTLGHNEEHSNRKHRLYNPSLNEIITNPVPFDANIGANGALRGGGKLGHRVTAIGHDPILGLIFGTANIATATLTNNDFESFHITTVNNRECFGQHARTDLVLSKTIEKVLYEGKEGAEKVAYSLFKEVVHLMSDINTKNSLALPFVSVFDASLASKLATYGLDMCNVATISIQYSMASFIDFIISVLHAMLFDGLDDPTKRKLYEVRTRKIIIYSNLIASSSNIAVVAITEDFNKLDVGGIANTIIKLITNTSFIREVKREFVLGGYRNMIKEI